jgi:hypothetical protein
MAMMVAAFSFAVVGCGDSDDGDDSSGGDGLIPDGTGVKVVLIKGAEQYSGVDLMNDFYDFAVGDKITAKGKLVAGTLDNKYGTTVEIVIKGNKKEWATIVYQYGSKPEIGEGLGGTWNCNVTLTQDMIDCMQNKSDSDPVSIRIQGNNIVANTLKFTIEDLKVIKADSTPTPSLQEYLVTRNFDIGFSDFGNILPGSGDNNMGCQKAGGLTAEIIYRPL